MRRSLRISLGQYSDRGCKFRNQDFHGAITPDEPLLTTKGIAVALADGISSSGVSHIASESAVTGFLSDYFCTSEAWSVKNSAHRVLAATNSWLHAQTRKSQFRFDLNKGYVCTFSALILKSNTVHVFHIGDSRVFRVQGNQLEQLTQDHRIWISEEENYLGRALGFHSQLDIDYHTFTVGVGDVLVLTTDGVHDYANAALITSLIEQYAEDLDLAAARIVEEALGKGSQDNLTIQIVRVDELPELSLEETHQQLTELPFPPQLSPRQTLDGYEIIRDIHISPRSHIYLARDQETDNVVVLKAPSTDLQEDTAYLERFLMEDWIARRIKSPFVLKPYNVTRKPSCIYTVTEYIEGQTLTQWMLDNPKPDIETVRNIVEQISRGIMAFHRMEMLHQDLRPENIMIDDTGTIKIIDFGSTWVSGLMEIDSPIKRHALLGTAMYSAPEYFIGEYGTGRSDLFSLGVITYQMLSSSFPYGTDVAKCKTQAALHKLVYRSIQNSHESIPPWIDFVLKKAVHVNPAKRYEELSEFTHDLRNPDPALMNQAPRPLIERNPLAFWQGLSAVLLIIIVVLLARLAS